jgi:hypothetical protein
MAFEYQGFASLGVNLNRQKYGPLDISNVFTSEADLKYYLSKGAYTEGVSEYWTKVVPYPYEGQVLATVINGVVNVYALALDAEGAFTTQEIAGKIEVDGETVKLNEEGKIELAGMEELEAGKTYVPSLVNGKLVWAEPDTTTAEGQAQEIEGLKSRVSTIEGELNGESGLKAKTAALESGLATEITNRTTMGTTLEGKIAEALATAKKYADDNDSDTIYDDSEIKAAIALKANLADVYNKDAIDTKFEDVNEVIANITHFTVELVESTEQMTKDNVLYLIQDETATGTDKFNEYLVIGGIPTLIGDTTTNLSNYVTKSQLEEHESSAIATFATKAELISHASEAANTYATKTALENHETAAEAKYATKEELEDGLADKANTTDFDNYYTKEEIDNKGYAVASEVIASLSTKVDKGSISHTSESVAEGVTVEGTELKIVVDAYTKAETLDKIQEKITEINGGESAGEVLSQLNSYIETNNTRVGNIEAKDASQDQAIANTVTLITELENGKVATNTGDINAIKGRLTTLETTKGDHETRISAVEGKATALDTATKNNSASIGEIEGQIVLLQAKDNEIAGLIKSNTDTIGTLATKTALEEAMDGVYTKSEVDDAIASLNVGNISSEVAGNKTAIAAEVKRASDAEKEINDTILGLVGNDTGKSIREIASAEVAKIVDAAPEAYDTLKEIAVWIEEDKTGAAAMSSAISGLSTILAGFGGEGNPATVKEYIDANQYILGIAAEDALGGIKAAAAAMDNGVQVSAEGIATVGRINVNTLV